MKFNRILASVLAVTVVGANMPAVSVNFPKISMTANAEGTESPLKYEILEDGTIEITGCDETVITVEIPAEIDGKMVTTIGKKAFYGFKNLTSINIPDSVTSIGYSAFYKCSNLKSITIPDSVTTIDSGAFDGCSGMTSITISDSVTSLSERVFGGCSGLTSVTIPDSVTSIGGSAFWGCKGLTSVIIPDSVTSIGGGAFFSTPWLENRQKENPLVIVNGILIDGKTCSGDAVIPDVVTSISDYAFQECSDLTSITIPDSVTNIGDMAFWLCSSLTSITILNPNCEIYDDPNTISNDYDNGFNGTIYGYENSTAQAYAEKYERKFESLGEAPALESYLKYKTLEDGTIEITGCDETVTTVKIPAEIDGKKVTSIGEAALEGYTGFTSVTIPDSVISIGDSAFNCCAGLTKILIPDSVTSIGEKAFANCSELTSVTIPNGVTSINEETFYGCISMKEIAIPDGVTIIGSDAFELCSSLTSITIPESVTSIGNSAFSECTGLTEIIIPENVTSIGDSVFWNCAGLEKITILNPNCEIYDSEPTISNTATIYGYDNSTAQAYAEKYNRKFESLGEAPATELAMGDVNGDNTIDSSDAVVVLVDYSLTSTGKKSTLTDAQKAVADIDKDGKIDSSDASFILSYYSYISTGGTETDMSKWFGK